MNVIRLDPTTFLADSLVENYSTMIWTERFLAAGEFEMHTPDIAETKALLPTGSLISIIESNEVMFVEQHEIDRPDEGLRELVITGRTFDTFMENRVIEVDQYNVPQKMLKQYHASEMIALLLWNRLVNATGVDPERIHAKDIRTAIADLVITDSSTPLDPIQDWWLAQGQADTTMRDLLTLGMLGIRAIRPSNSDGTIMSFDTSVGGNRGTVIKTYSTNISQMRLDVYDGTDRTLGQQDVDPVIFNYGGGDISDTKYLFSSKDVKNAASIASSIGTSIVGDLTAVGLAFRELYFDDGDIGTTDYATYIGSITQNGLVELAKHTDTFLFDGAISPLSMYKYGADYFLGDHVTLMAEYDTEEAMMVTEYIRTEDSAGDRGYPTLVLA